MMVVDLRHWLRADGSLEPRARLGPHVALVVECATSAPALDMPIPTAMTCRHRDRRRSCRGLIHLRLIEEAIDWHCSERDDGGVVTGWKETRWDLAAATSELDELLPPVFLGTDELRGVRDLDLPPAIRRELAAAVDPMHAMVKLTHAELVVLVDAVGAANARGRARERLHIALGRIEQVRLGYELERRARAN